MTATNPNHQASTFGPRKYFLTMSQMDFSSLLKLLRKTLELLIIYFKDRSLTRRKDLTSMMALKEQQLPRYILRRISQAQQEMSFLLLSQEP
ncbi:hypothetical protein FGO68_gene9297 [Halteria grandinella]|uniref:Uncharacterized protein n=1 Tax=Halteria grandinella TaxID=5974 RepID=A0A8J8NAJ7_HALGN|nr:hypothetical protein FGO68_gene9297 [Halteria grandinella]